MLSDVCRYLGLPFMGTAGTSEAEGLDMQAAIESTVQVLLSALSGTPMVHDEMIDMTRRIMRGMEVSDNTLMLDLIDAVGPGGEFLSTKDTARRCRAEIWDPALMDRQNWVSWTKGGAQSMDDRSRDRLHHILTTHRPLPLPDGAAERI